MEAAALRSLRLGASSRGPASACSSGSSAASCSSAGRSDGDKAGGRPRRKHTMSSGSSRSSRSSRRHSSSGGSGSGSGAALDLPLDREFLPLPGDQEAEESGRPADSAAAARDHVRHDVLCMLFDLPGATVFYQDFSCAIAASLAMHGRMYPTSTHVCFYSNVFGRERKILIPYESIAELAKTTTMVFQNAIRLRTTDGEQDYTFASFWGNNRDRCFELIAQTRERVLKELRPTVVRSFARGAGAGGSSTALTLLDASRSASPASAERGDEAPAPPEAPTEVECSVSAEKEAETEAEAETETETQPSADAPPVDATPEAAAAACEPTASADSGEASEELARPTRQRQRSVVSDVERIAPKDISMTRIMEETFPVSVDAFMAAFFLDGAPFGMGEFGARTGATDMSVSAWTAPLGQDKAFGMTRSQQFRVPVEAPIGPKSSRVDVLQCLKEERNVRVVETSTRLADIPYGDYFSVEDRWTVVPHAEAADACQVTMELKVVFGKSTFWKAAIESRAISDNRAKWAKWVAMARAFLDARARPPPAADGQGPEAAAAAAADRPDPPKAIERRQSSGHSAASAGHERPHSHSHSHSRPRSGSSSRRRSRAVAAAAPASASQARGRHVPVKVFPWILVLLLLFVVVRLQTTLSTIEASLEVTARRVLDVQAQLARLETAACPAAPLAP